MCESKDKADMKRLLNLVRSNDEENNTSGGTGDSDTDGAWTDGTGYYELATAQLAEWTTGIDISYTPATFWGEPASDTE